MRKIEVSQDAFEAWKKLYALETRVICEIAHEDRDEKKVDRYKVEYFDFLRSLKPKTRNEAEAFRCKIDIAYEAEQAKASEAMPIDRLESLIPSNEKISNTNVVAELINGGQQNEAGRRLKRALNKMLARSGRNEDSGLHIVLGLCPLETLCGSWFLGSNTVESVLEKLDRFARTFATIND